VRPQIFTCCLNNNIPANAAQLKELDHYNDKFIVFRAIDAAWCEILVLAMSTRPSFTRKASQPVNRQITIEPHRASQHLNKPLKVENTSTMGEDEDVPFNVDYLRELMEETSPERLEYAVKRGMKLILSIRGAIDTHSEGQAHTEEWLTQIDELRAQAMLTRTVIGVVGNTGAGKSSVINALLDEERLLPTNCMRACTAAVTEISWNEDEDEHKRYKAEIEFISATDWEKELTIMFHEMTDGSGKFIKECTNPDTEAGVAYAKVRSVYPQMTKEGILKAQIPSLLMNHGVSKVLGTTTRFEDGRPDSFYRRLQKYVDSNEKEVKDRPKGGGKPIEYWPLIKCVKIYARSDALSTGAVIVDLPGVQDSNAARAAVAESYMRQCSGLWIVAPINRAVNDKAAKNLLGDQFKRQMKYDGMFSNVTFICSKTDDISITEAVESLSIESQVQEPWDEISKLENERDTLQRKVDELNRQYDTYGTGFIAQDELIEVWEEHQDQPADREEVDAPLKKNISKKRKRDEQRNKPRKHINLSSDAESDEDMVSERDESDETSAAEDNGSWEDPLMIEQIKAKSEARKLEKAVARKEKSNIDALIAKTTRQIKQISEKIRDLQADVDALCITGRNNYSKDRIRDDYAMGIKELDQQNAIEEDEENFNPDVDIRDYEKLANSLPVFCVSSRAYQKMCGRLEKDSNVTGFKTLEETEMPQLKQHCKKLTEAGRMSNCRVFLNSLSRLLLSLSLWSGNNECGIKLTNKQRKLEVSHLQKQLDFLESAFDEAVKLCTRDVEDTLEDKLFRWYPAAQLAAQEAALPTVEQWGSHRSTGGLWYATYKAICRRNGGPWNSTSGTHDFNKQLSEPIEKHLVSGWERCFQRQIPAVLETFNQKMGLLLREFHKKIADRRQLKGTGAAGMHVLSMKLQILEARFGQLSQQMAAIISEEQKKANRKIKPVISEAMEDAYLLCTSEHGEPVMNSPVWPKFFSDF
jgi:GTPase SAR1 family protein